MSSPDATYGQRLLSYLAGPTISNINETSTSLQHTLSSLNSASALQELLSTSNDLRGLVTNLSQNSNDANATFARTAAEIVKALDAAQHSLHKADETAAQVRDTLNNPGGGLSGQPTIPRGDFTQRLCSFYYDVFNKPGEKAHHVLVVYDRSPRLVSFREVLGSNGRYVQGPTEMWTVQKKIHRGKGRIGLWGFYVWVFREGTFELLGDGGFINWCFKSPNCERDGKKVTFHQL